MTWNASRAGIWASHSAAFVPNAFERTMAGGRRVWSPPSRPFLEVVLVDGGLREDERGVEDDRLVWADGPLAPFAGDEGIAGLTGHFAVEDGMGRIHRDVAELE